jgi:hypothetical protein
MPTIDLRVICTIGFVLLLLIGERGTIASLAKSAWGKVASFRGTLPDPSSDTIESMCVPTDIDFVWAFRLVKPRITAAEASALWARLEPAASTLETAEANATTQPAAVTEEVVA